MNRCYRLVWNRNSARWVVAHERARSRGKRAGALRAISAAVAAVLTGFAASAQALPTGGQVSAGTGSIAQSGTAMTVSQDSHKLAVNWQSFGIGAGEAVTFKQPDSSAIALNRVLGTDPSQIYGRLSANGQVFLLNPNGLLFGPGAQVNVGGLVASTLNLSDSDFMAGRYSFAGSGGSVVNQGSINAADGGYVALLGAQVTNQGTIQARLGTVALAAGKKVTLDLAGDSLVSLQVDEGVVDALAQNKQLIRADGGTALLTAKAASTLEAAVVNNSGVVEAQTIENHGGVIRLVGDAQNGVAQVGGTLDASAPNGGDGGQVETSAAKVQVADDAVVTTAASAGHAGTWLIDPKDFTIAASGGDMTGATLSSNLASGDVVIASSDGAAGSAGDINVNDPVSWGADTALTLNASNDINVNSSITASGAGSALNLHANSATGDPASGGGSVNIVNNTVNVAGTVNVTGVDLNVGSAGESAPSQLLTGDLDATLSGNVSVLAGSGTGITATIASGGTQTISVAGNVVISGGEGSNSIAMIQGNGAAQTVSVTGSITATAGGNSSNGSGNKAYILKGGGGMQTVSAHSVQLTGGGGTAGGENKAAILTAPNSSASQQVNIGAGGLSVLAGSGSAAGNTAGIWVLDDYPPANNTATLATQLVSVLGNVSITGGSNGATAGNNNASIFQSSTGAGASQTVSVAGSIALTGGASGTNGGAFISSDAPSQTVDAGGIVIHGGGGMDGMNNGAGIFQNNVAGAQSIAVNGTGSISITGGSGSAGLNTAQIYSVGSGGQTINFTSGGAINLTGGTGVIDSGAFASNYVKIETTAGNQTITGVPSITIQGGTGGGSSGGSNNLGNFALIRADGGAQSIDAGAISLAVPSSGTSSSATIQGPIQTINASSVALIGGGSVGPFSGARIGGHGGSVGGPTNLTLTTSGPVTLTGGSTAGASIGSHAGSATDITIHSGGSVTLTPGTGAGVLIGTPEGTSAGGNISISAQGDIRLDQTGAVGSGIYTSGNVSLFANAGGSIVEQPVSAIQANSLTTVSYGGTTLQGENLVAGFSAANYTSGDIVLNDTAPILNLVGIGNYATGGSVTIVNGSEINVTGNVSSANGGDLALAAGVYVPGDLVIGNPGASVWVTAGTDSANTGDMTLSGTNVRIDGGNGSLPTYVGLTGSGTQRVTTPGDFVVAATAFPNGTAFLTANDSAAQQVNVGGDLQLLGGEGSGNSATLSVNGTGAQTVTVTGTIEAIAGGNSSNGDSSNARIMQNGSGLQTVSANSIVLTGGGGTFGTNNSAAIMTTPNSSASQQVTVGAGGLVMQGGTGSGSGNKAGIWVLDDYSTDHGTSSAQTLTVAGNISLTGGSNADAAVINNNNNASIFQSSTGVGATQTVTAFGGIALTGGTSGANGGAYISSLAPNQSVSAGSGGIALQGGGGVDGSNDTAAIVQNNFGGSQSVTMGGGGLISLAGGSGNRGSNSAGIYSVGSGPQTINFPTGGALAVTGGSGVPLSTAGSSNFARIEATAGDQSITGGPSITIQGGSGGADLVGSTNLGNYAFIRADTGLQSIDAGAIVLSVGASGTNSSATIQGPTQSINATSVALTGGGSVGPFSGARIGGRGGTVGGPTYLTLTTSGPITLTGGSASGAAIGSHAGWTSDIAINAGGDVTLAPGTGAGVRIGSPAGSVSGGNISIFSKGNITLGENGGIGSGIYTTGDVTLNVTTGPAGKSIFEAPASAIVANSLTTSSDTGTLLLGTNQIGSFNAANYGSGDVVLNDAMPLLDVTNIWNNGFGGSVNITNSGGIDVTGNVFTADNGDLILAAGGDLLIGNPMTGISVFGGSSPGHTGNLTLSGANIAILGGSGGFDTFVGLSGSGTEQITTPGNLTITATASPNGAVYLAAGGGVTQSISVGGTLALSGGQGTYNSATIQQGGSGVQDISAGNILLSGGEGASSSASILQFGAGAQTIAASGAITASAGGNSSSGSFNSADITDSGSGVQTVSAHSIVLAGGGGASGASNTAGIAQYNFSGTQNVTVNGGGSISITGGSGSGGANFAQIYSRGSGPQTIAFTSGGSIELTGGTGAPVSGAPTSNFARIEATSGGQSISGGPSILIQGGSDGSDYDGTTNLGNFAFIRADNGLQGIDAGAITLTAGASGINNSASIQGPTQMINASSVALIGGGGSGGYAGARIGGRGGLAGGPTNLTLTTTGAITLTGGSTTGVAIGANPSGGGPTNITIDAGGDVLLTPGAVAGVRVGSPADLLDGGNISITSQGRIRLNQVGGIGSGIYTTGDVNLTANAVGGRIFVPLASQIVANALTTVSDEGTFIRGANRVGSFSGTNYSANGVIFYDATPALDVTSIWNNASGGNVYVSNSGDVNVTGNVFAADGGNLSLIAGGDLLIGNPVTGISVFAGSGPANTGNMTLSGANIGIVGGNAGLATFVGLSGSGTQSVTTPGNFTIAATASSSGAATLGANDSVTQLIDVGGNLTLAGGEGTNNVAIISATNGAQTISAGGITLTGGEGTNSRAMIQSAGGGAQTVTVGGSIVATAGGNLSGDSQNNAYILKGGSGMQTVSANSVELTGGGGASGDGNHAAILTAPDSSASQQVDIGPGGLNVQAGSGAGGANTAGIWVLDDYYTDHGTASTQVVNVAGDVSVTGGGNNPNAFANNNASIFQSSTGAGASQSVSVDGTITLTGASSGTNGNAFISSDAPGQAVSAGGIAIYGNGGADGVGDTGAILQNNAGGTQSITVNGGGSISLTGGSGSGGSNTARIYSLGSGTQSIAFTSGGAIELNGGAGAIDGTAGAGNYATIEATAGDQTIAGLPSITIQGGTGGGTSSDPMNTGNLGNFAFIRATGAQNIDAGAISLAAGASGIDSSATIQGPLQTIDASSVSISGGGASGSFSGARIGGRGGYVTGPTDLTLTTTGSITVSGGSADGAAIGANPRGGTTTDVTIYSGGDVTLAPGTGAGVRIGATPSTLSPGTISITSGGNITLGQNGSVGSGIYSAGDVSLTAGGSIAEQPLSKILGNSLTTVSDAGTLLGGPNQVAVFNATNATSGNVSLLNTANPLTITGITNNGGDISVDNTGAIVTTGLISAPAGSVSIVAHSPLTIGAAGVSAGGNVSLSAGQTADPGDALELDGPVGSTGGGAIVLYAGDDLLQNADVSTNGGSVSATSEDGSITMAAGTTTGSGGGAISYAAPSGDINVSSLDAGTGAIDLSAGGNVQPSAGSTGVNLTGGSATVDAGGDVTLTTQLRRPAKVSAGGTVSVTKLHPCRGDDSCDDDDRDHDGHHGDDQGDWDRDRRGDGDQWEDR